MDVEVVLQNALNRCASPLPSPAYRHSLAAARRHSRLPLHATRHRKSSCFTRNDLRLVVETYTREHLDHIVFFRFPREWKYDQNKTHWNGNELGIARWGKEECKLSLRCEWKWNGNKNEIIEMRKIWYKKIVTAHL